MKTEIIKLAKHSLIYGFGIFIGKAASFIMLPVYTRYLTPADYGTIELLITTVDIVAMIAGVGLAATIFKYYSEYESEYDKKEVISTAVIMKLILAFIATTFGIILSPQISQIIFHRADNAFYFRLVFAILLLQQGVILIPLMFIRAIQNSKLFVVINAVKLILQVALNVYFLVVLEMGILGVLISTVIAEFVVGFYLFAYIFKKVGFQFSIEKCKKMTRFGYPFMFVSLSGFILTYSDRYFLNAFGDLETVGIYALGYKFGFLMFYLAVTPFMQIWQPERFEIAKQDDALRIFKKVFLYFSIVIVSLSLLISIFVKDLLILRSEPMGYLKENHTSVVVAYIRQ